MRRLWLGRLGGQAYGEGREQGLEPREAQHYAALTAAAEAVPEAIVVGKLLQAGSGIIKGVLKRDYSRKLSRNDYSRASSRC